MKRNILSKSIIVILTVFLFAGALATVAGCKRGPKSEIERLKKGVTEEDISKKVEEIEKNFKANSKGKKLPEAVKKNIEKQAKEMLKRDRSMLLLADKKGVKISEKQVDKRISKIKSMLNKTNKKAFDDMLKKQGKTEEEFKQTILKQMIFEDLRKKLSKNVKVTDKEIQAFYDKNKSIFTDPKDPKKIRDFKAVKGLIKQMLTSQKVSAQINKLQKSNN